MGYAKKDNLIMDDNDKFTTILVEIAELRKDVGHVKEHTETHTPQIYTNKDNITILKTKQNLTQWLGSGIAAVILGTFGYIIKLVFKSHQ